MKLLTSESKNLDTLGLLGSTHVLGLPYVYSAFHPSGVGISSTGLAGWGYGGARSLVSGGR